MRESAWVQRLTTIRRAVGSYGVLIVIAASITLNLLQSHRLKALSRTPDAAPRAGTLVPGLDVTDADATPVRIEYGPGQRPTILYFFSPSCSWCERNWPAVHALERATRGRYRFVAVTTAGGDERQTRASGLPVPTYWGWSETGRQSYQLRGTPHTVVIAPTGRVLRSWIGAYTGAARAELERYFQVDLPELSSRQRPR